MPPSLATVVLLGRYWHKYPDLKSSISKREMWSVHLSHYQIIWTTLWYGPNSQSRFLPRLSGGPNQAYNDPTSTSGAVWGSISCPRTLRHADQGNWTSDFWIKRCWLYPWGRCLELEDLRGVFNNMNESLQSVRVCLLCPRLSLFTCWLTGLMSVALSVTYVVISCYDTSKRSAWEKSTLQHGVNFTWLGSKFKGSR